MRFIEALFMAGAPVLVASFSAFAASTNTGAAQEAPAEAWCRSCAFLGLRLIVVVNV